MILNFKFLLLLFMTIIIVYNYKYILKSNNNIKRNSVICLIRGYNENQIMPFLVTLRNTSPATSLIVFTDNYTIPILNKYIKHSLLHIIIINDEYPYYPLNYKQFFIKENDLKEYIPTYITSSSSIFFWNSIRYNLFNVWLLNFGNMFDWYFITDVRDVLFQSDIFALSFPTGVHLLSEIYNRSGSIGIKGCSKNVKWIKPFNPTTEIMKNPIINSGTILGSRAETIKFITEFSAFMNKEKKITAEQGALNYFYYTRKFKYPVYVYEHERGYCLSIHTDYWMFSDIFTPINGTLYGRDNKPAVCIHGWDHAFYTGSEHRKEGYRELLKKRVGIYVY